MGVRAREGPNRARGPQAVLTWPPWLSGQRWNQLPSHWAGPTCHIYASRDKVSLDLPHLFFLTYNCSLLTPLSLICKDAANRKPLDTFSLMKHNLITNHQSPLADSLFWKISACCVATLAWSLPFGRVWWRLLKSPTRERAREPGINVCVGTPSLAPHGWGVFFVCSRMQCARRAFHVHP